MAGRFSPAARRFAVAGALLAGIVMAAPPAHASERLLISRLTGGTWQIWLVDASGEQQRQLTDGPGDKRYPAWISDDAIGYCTTNQQCFRLRLDPTAALKPILAEVWPVRDAAWSPDGARVVFSKFRTDLIDSANLWISDAAGTTRGVLTHAPGIQQNAAWSPDGRFIAYSGGQGYQTYEIYIVPAEGGEPTRLTENRSHEFLPAWSPDGRRIAFSSDRTDDYEIWVMDADGGNPTRLTDSSGLDTRPAWSPDGARIAFATNRTGTMQVWVMNADGSDSRPLIATEGGAGDPAWR
jgi:Tol biopolymer transport system component